MSQSLIVNHFLRGVTGLFFVDWLIGWFFNVPLSLSDNCLWDVLLEINVTEHSCKSSVCLCVLSEFTDGKSLFRFAVKRTNVLSIFCDSGHLSYRYPYGWSPLRVDMSINERKWQQPWFQRVSQQMRFKLATYLPWCWKYCVLLICARWDFLDIAGFQDSEFFVQKAKTNNVEMLSEGDFNFLGFIL